MKEKQEQIKPLPTEVEKLISKIGQAKYKLIVLLLDEYSNLTARKARRLISKEYNIDTKIIKIIQNQ